MSSPRSQLIATAQPALPNGLAVAHQTRRNITPVCGILRCAQRAPDVGPGEPRRAGSCDRFPKSLVQRNGCGAALPQAVKRIRPPVPISPCPQPAPVPDDPQSPRTGDQVAPPATRCHILHQRSGNHRSARCPTFGEVRGGFPSRHERRLAPPAEYADAYGQIFPEPRGT
jgi:hypothetical protein